jgi:hypothetical protein
MPATIVKPEQDLGVVSPAPSPPYGYLLLSAAVAPPAGPPLVRRDARRTAVESRLAELMPRVATLEPVVRATAFRALLMPPGAPPKFRPALKPPRYDIVVMVETDVPGSLEQVTGDPTVATVRSLLGDHAKEFKETQARCIRAIADVDKRATGVYLFNYWAAEDRDVALEVWEHLATWFQAKTGLRNSTVLEPLDNDDFAFVNHARWDTSLLGVALHQFTRPSFFTYVRPNLRANDVEVYPALYRKI